MIFRHLIRLLVLILFAGLASSALAKTNPTGPSSSFLPDKLSVAYRHIDTDADGKEEGVFRRTKNGLYTKESWDLNKDGKFDLIIEKIGRYHFHHQDLNFDGQFDRKTVTSSSWDQKLVSKAYKWNNDRWQFLSAKSIELPASYAAEKNRCNILHDIQSFVSEMDQSVFPKAVENHTELPNGIVVHESCYKRHGVGRYNSMIKETINEGLQCLIDLESRYKTFADGQSPGALVNAERLKARLETEQVQLWCSSHDIFNDIDIVNGGFIAGIAVPDKQVHHQLKLPADLKAPAVLLNPEMGWSDSFIRSHLSFQNSSLPRSQFKSVLFHELMHLTGHNHGLSIEYPEACATCCISDPSNQDACAICAGKYTDTRSANYLSALKNLNSYYASKTIRANINKGENLDELHSDSIVHYIEWHLEEGNRHIAQYLAHQTLQSSERYQLKAGHIQALRKILGNKKTRLGKPRSFGSPTQETIGEIYYKALISKQKIAAIPDILRLATTNEFETIDDETRIEVLKIAYDIFNEPEVLPTPHKNKLEKSVNLMMNSFGGI